GVALAGTTGGLAATGNLPDAAQDALAKAAARAGFELPAGAGETDPAQTDTGTVPGQTGTATLPDQASDTAKRVHAVKDAWEGEKGCEFGQAVAAAARDTEPKECKNSDEAEATGESEEKTTGKPEGAPGGNANGQSEETGTLKAEK
ncbi:MAG: hypothetical protein ACRDKZ_02195, partial [Actinomycetota bacterium]